MSQRRLAGKRSLITGASSGIGLATASLFAAEGCHLVLLARNGPRLREIADELSGRHNVRIHTIAADVRDTAILHEKLAAADAATPIDIVIANAGIGQYGPFHASQWDDIEAVLHTNIDGTIATVHAAVRGMAARRRGSVVLVSSVLGKRAIQWNAAYCASKFALLGFADALRLELETEGVHVGVVFPARTKTEFFRNMRYSAQQSRRRPVPEAEPGVVAQAILRTVLSRKRESIVSIGGRLYAGIGYHFPRITDFILKRAVVHHDTL